MANIAEIIEDQACRMRGRAVEFDGKHSPDNVSVAELFDRAESNLYRARRNWMAKNDKQSITDATDVCNLLAIAVGKLEKG